jgi:threonine dehydratase
VEIFTASEEAIREATYRIMERIKVVIEPSAAVTLAVLLENPGLVRGSTVGIVLCGGNIDIRRLPI